MRRRRATTTVRLVALCLVTAALVTWPEAASARTVPETLADRRPVRPAAVQPGFAIDYVGVFWDGEQRHAHGAQKESAPHGAVRFSHDGSWGPWVRLTEDGIESRGRWASGLVSADGAEAYQVRGVPDAAVRPQAVALNTTDGPLIEVASEPGGAAHAVASSACRSRAEWGADETLRFDAQGNERWRPEFQQAQVMTVHHTATRNADPDPAATVRAIYRYHAVDQGWGDIGYQYLVDESGIVYEGRWSGTESPRCGAGGDAGEFAHEAGGDRVVTGAHTGGWNSGNVGVALLGDFTAATSTGAPPASTAVSAVEQLLAELARRHGLDPTGRVAYVNPVSGAVRDVETISGHRDYTATECPGERLYQLLPQIRANVKEQMAAPADTAPTVVVDSPADGSTVQGTTLVSARAGDDRGVDQVEFTVDGVIVGTDTAGSDGWSASWDTTAFSDGAHAVTARATDTSAQSTRHSITVTVDNVADPPPPGVHVGDLEGTSAEVKKGWRATIRTTVLSAGSPLSGVEVRGSWSTGGTATCTTRADGVCPVYGPTLRRTVTSVRFIVDDLVRAGYRYTPERNVDADRDSDGTAITVLRP